MGTKTVPLSFAQQRLWFIDRFEPNSALYNIPLVLRLQGRLDPGTLARALGEIVRRHEVLRTRFKTIKDVPVQVISPELGRSLPVVDLTGLPEGSRRATAHGLALAEARQSFDLARCPLLRTTLVRLDAGPPERAEHELLFTVHHIVFDGWSVGVFLRELTTLYQAFSTGDPSPLPELPVQYADYAVWQRQRLSKDPPGEELESQLTYWREQLAGLPVLELPTDRPRPAVQSFRGALHCVQLPAELNRRLAQLSRRHRSTLFVTLMAAFQALLGRTTCQVDLAVGTAIANRQPAEIQGLLGLFVNTLVLRGDLSGSPTFGQLLRRLHRVALRAYAHQDLPFEMLVEELKPERDLSHNPLVQVFLTLQYASMEARELAPGLGLSLEYPSTGKAKFDLSLSLEEDGEELRCELIYGTDLFDATTIHRLVGHFRRVLEAVAADSDERLAELPLLSGAEGQQLLVEWNDTRRRCGHARPSLEPSTLHHLFERQVARTPEAVAAVVPPEGDKWGVAGRHLSYRELNRRANRLAHTLRALGVKPEALVGICLDRSLEMVTGILGILKSGGAYLPLDPAYPSQRLAFMLEDAGARVLLTRKRLLELLPEHRARVVCLDADQDELAVHSPVNPKPVATAANLAYLIYTSGSTGRAKGVAIEHRSGVGLLEWVREVFAPEEVAGVLGATSLCFDLSLFELFAPLARGGKVIVAESVLDLPGLAAAQAVTLVNTVPSAMRELTRLADLPRSVRTVNLAGEILQRELVDELYRHPGVERVFNLYGPTEDTTYSTCARLERGGDGPPSIGRPVADTRAYLLDRHQRPVPLGVPGELFLGGAGLARGYLDRPELTAERFVPDPFGEIGGERLYRTGDLVRALANGELAFLGRLDHQVKVRGFRIELGEIETVLVRHPGVREAVAVIREDPGPARLVAYAVAQREDVTVPELREFLHRTLPEYMVPSLFVILEAMPRGPTGKVDRRALPAPEATGGGGERDNPSPRTPTEEMMADLWSRILGTRRIGIRDNFFELGGHSLVATRLLSRLREVFGVELDLRSVFQHPTLAGLAERTDRARRAGQGLVAPPIRPAARGEGVALSFAQQRLWFLTQLTPDLAIYNIPLALRLCGPLDRPALEDGLREIVRRHEVLRTRYEMVEGKPVQVVRELAPRALPVVELTGADEAQRRTEAHRLALAAARQPFDLAQEPPLRVALLRLADTPEGEEHLLLVTVHHIAFDGWSIGVFLHELAALYQAFSARLPSPLPELAVQYADFAEWQRRWLGGEVLETQLAYWREQLAGLSVLELVADRPRPVVPSFRGTAEDLRLPAELSHGLTELGRRHGTTGFMTLLAAFQALLGRTTGRQDLAVGTAIANRNRTEIEGLLGFFVNTLVLRSDLCCGPQHREATCGQLLAHVRDLTLDAYAHQDLPFEMLVEALEPERDLSRNPLVQVFFILQNAPRIPRQLAPELEMRLEPVATGAARFDLTLLMEEDERGIRGEVQYCTDLFDATTIRRLAGHFRTVLAGMMADPDRRLSELPLLPAAERHALLCEWNHSPHRDLGAVCCHERFAARAAESPDAVAVVSRNGQLSYGELNARAARLAVHLRSLGVGPEALVGLFLERSQEALVGIFGVLRAGGAYLPLDPATPRERLAFMLEDGGSGDGRMPVILTREPLAAQLPPHAAHVVRLDADWPAIAAASPENVPCAVAASSLAYSIYTSGSTGRPKGVQVAHRGICQMAEALRWRYDVSAGSRVLLWASWSFDAAAAEIFTTLLAGGTLCLGSPDDLLAGPDLIRILRRQEVTNLTLVPSALQVLPVTELPALRSLVVAGEACSAAVVRPWAAGRRLTNAYGPTEATVCATAARISLRGEEGRSPSIGRPVAMSRVYVLDRRGDPVPIGIPGELAIGGPGLARGYLGHPGLTAARFVPDRWTGSGRGGERLYRTGDLVHFLPDGELEFLGRIDEQVKIRGFRVEPGEIEAVLSRHPGVRQAVVLLRPDPSGDQRLVAYAAIRGRITVAGLRQFLGEKLPDYMVPAVFLLLEELPLLASGKVDRRALPEPDWRAEDGISVAPRSPVEEMLAEIWTEVLGRERIAGRLGVHDDFFELGGHSLLAAQVISRVRATFGVELPLRHLFEGPTVAALGESIEAALTAGGAPAAPAIEPVPRPDRLPLSFAQQRLWFLDLVNPGDPTFNMPFAARLSGVLDRAALARSLQEIVTRHEALRTTIATREGRPYQVIAAALTLDLPLVELRRLFREAGDGEARRLSVVEGRRSFDLERGPLLRAVLLRLADREHLLLLNLHHLVGDGWSFEVLLGELAVLYEAFSAGRASPLPDLSVQYADWATWQRQWLEGEALETQLAYWREQLAGPLPVLELAAGGPRRSGRVARGGQCSVELPESLAAGLRSLSREAGATLFMTLLAAFDVLLYRTTGQTDLVVGSPVANRGRGEIEGLIGFFVNTLVLRTDLAWDPTKAAPTFRELLARVREVALGAYAHPDVPFEKLVEELQPDRVKSRTPFFQVMMTLDRASNSARRLGDLVIEPQGIHNRTAQFDLTLVIVDTGGVLHAGLEYDRDLFEPATAARWLEHFRNVLAGIVADPERRLSDLPFGANGMAGRGARPTTGDERPVTTPVAHAWVKQKEAIRQAKLTRRRARLSAVQLALLKLRLEGKPSDPKP